MVTKYFIRQFKGWEYTGNFVTVAIRRLNEDGSTFRDGGKTPCLEFVYLETLGM